MPDITHLLGKQVYGNAVPRVRQICEADLDARSAPEGRGPEWPESIPPGLSASDKSNRMEVQRGGGRALEGACCESKCRVGPDGRVDKAAKQIWTQEGRPEGAR